MVSLPKKKTERGEESEREQPLTSKRSLSLRKQTRGPSTPGTPQRGTRNLGAAFAPATAPPEELLCEKQVTLFTGFPVREVPGLVFRLETKIIARNGPRFR